MSFGGASPSYDVLACATGPVPDAWCLQGEFSPVPHALPPSPRAQPPPPVALPPPPGPMEAPIVRPDPQISRCHPQPRRPAQRRRAPRRVARAVGQAPSRHVELRDESTNMSVNLQLPLSNLPCHQRSLGIKVAPFRHAPVQEMPATLGRPCQVDVEERVDVDSTVLQQHQQSAKAGTPNTGGSSTFATLPVGSEKDAASFKQRRKLRRASSATASTKPRGMAVEQIGVTAMAADLLDAPVPSPVSFPAAVFRGGPAAKLLRAKKAPPTLLPPLGRAPVWVVDPLEMSVGSSFGALGRARHRIYSTGPGC